MSLLSTHSIYFETESSCVAQVGLELSVFLPQPPHCWITAVHCHAWLCPLGLGFSSPIHHFFLGSLQSSLRVVLFPIPPSLGQVVFDLPILCAKTA